VLEWEVHLSLGERDKGSRILGREGDNLQNFAPKAKRLPERNEERLKVHRQREKHPLITNRNK